MTQLPINAIRTLAIDAVQQARSGILVLPMELGLLIFTFGLMPFDPEHQTA